MTIDQIRRKKIWLVLILIHDRQDLLPRLLKICETVVTETPAISAISLMVIFIMDLLSMFFLSVAKENLERKSFSSKGKTSYLLYRKKSVN